MSIETQLTFKEYLKLMYTLTYRKPIMILFSISALVIIGNSIKQGFASLNGMDIILVLFFIAVIPLSIYFGARKQFFSNQRLREKIVYHFSDEKMMVEGESFKSELDWRKVYKVRGLENWVLIYQSNQTANLIPKRSFGDQLTGFKRIATVNGLKAKWRSK